MVCIGIACDECVRRCEREHKKQGGFSPVDARFFKVMVGDDHPKVMYLPPKFARTVKHLTNKETQIEDVHGDRWSVTLSCVEGYLAFQKGWKKFSLEHDLKEGEFLLFNYIKGRHFIAHVFDRSACERKNFNDETLRPIKKSRRDQGTTSEDEPYQTADVYSGGKPISATSVASGDESQRRKTNLAAANADFGVSQHLPIPVHFKDTICIINRDDGSYEEEHRNLLYDLSSFEMENRTSDVKKSQKPLIIMLDPPRTETAQLDVNLENASDTKISFSCIGIIEPTKPAGNDAMKQTKTPVEDAETAGIQTDLITGNSGDISIDKFEKAVDAKRSLSHTEITDQIRKKVDDIQMASHSGQAGGHSRDAFTNKFYKKPSDNSNMKKGMLDNVCNFQDGNNHFPGSFSVSPSIGSSKIAEREHAVKGKFGEFSISSSAVKDPLGQHAIKKELVEMEDKANVFRQVSCGGKEPPVVWNRAHMISPQVKVEPDLSHETGPLDTIGSFSTCPFSAEVKSRFYLELPVNIARARGRKSRIEGMIVFLRDSVRRVWPVVYREYYGGRALTVNWTKFCEQNNIKPGDKCRFLVEDVTSRVYRVDVARGSG